MSFTSALPKLLNGIDVEALTGTMEAIRADPSLAPARFSARTTWDCGTVSNTHITGWWLGGRHIEHDFEFATDEPTELCGKDSAPNPQEYLQAAMNACILNTWVAACAVNGIELESLEIESSGELDLRGFLGISGHVPAGYEEIDYTVRIRGNGTQQQFEDVERWVSKTSPNYYNIANAIKLNATLEVL